MRDRCWECGRPATRIAPTTDIDRPGDTPLGCGRCFPSWPHLGMKDRLRLVAKPDAKEDR